jgi:ribosome-associated protein
MKEGADLQTSKIVDAAVEYALDKKGFDLKLFDVREMSSLTDFLLIVSGRSDRQVQAIAENVRIELKNKHEDLPLAVEGMDQGRWILLDYGELMVHVFQPDVREFYDLEGLWSEAPEIAIEQAEA